MHTSFGDVGLQLPLHAGYIVFQSCVLCKVVTFISIGLNQTRLRKQTNLAHPRVPYHREHVEDQGYLVRCLQTTPDLVE